MAFLCFDDRRSLKDKCTVNKTCFFFSQENYTVREILSNLTSCTTMKNSLEFGIENNWGENAFRNGKKWDRDQNEPENS